jgi:hypothetical protein
MPSSRKPRVRGGGGFGGSLLMKLSVVVGKSDGGASQRGEEGRHEQRERHQI